MNIMKLVLFFSIVPTDAISNINFKTACVQSGTQIDGTIYAAFPEPTDNGYCYCGNSYSNKVRVLRGGSAVANAYAYIIYK